LVISSFQNICQFRVYEENNGQEACELAVMIFEALIFIASNKYVSADKTVLLRKVCKKLNTIKHPSFYGSQQWKSFLKIQHRMDTLMMRDSYIYRGQIQFRTIPRPLERMGNRKLRQLPSFAAEQWMNNAAYHHACLN
jgi:hypothetical protein